jgi:superfamily II DNA or RNA helicase
LRKRDELYGYQRDSIERIKTARQLGVLLNMGLGKTVITLTALAEMRCHRVLVLAPATVVELDVWGEEARAWQHLSGVRVEPICGNVKQRTAKLMRICSRVETSVDVVSYENVMWLTDAINRGEYDAIVFDELSKMKHPGTTRFKRLRAWAKDIPVRIGLTGTPVGNHLLDLWGEMFMVAGEKPLGPRFVDFRAEFFAPQDFQMRQWELKNSSLEAEIIRRVKPYAFSLDPVEARTKMPEFRVNKIELRLPPQAAKMEAELAQTCATELEGGIELTALSASALGMKVRQLASGAVYHDIEGHYATVHNAKMDKLQEMVEAMQGEPLLVFYWFRHELDRILMWMPWAKQLSQPGVLEAWNRREVPLLLAHPGSAGHGLNLQHGGHNVAWFTLPWSLELWKQANGRLVRIGQKSQTVVAHVLLAGEADHMVLDVLGQKNAVEARVMEEVRLREHFLGLEDIL